MARRVILRRSQQTVSLGAMPNYRNRSQPICHSPDCVLREKHGPLMFHQSGGCCDGSSPMCYPRGEFLVGDCDVQLGEVDGEPFYMSRSQFEYWKHTQLILDVVPGRGGMFSLDSAEGVRFLIRSRVFDDAEIQRSARGGTHLEFLSGPGVPPEFALFIRWTRRLIANQRRFGKRLPGIFRVRLKALARFDARNKEPLHFASTSAPLRAW